ncbi:MAG: histidinol-phosphatase HisJ family protein [Halanaerobiales bacterium]|nr:histidinol-phosphatase HisJ family protein [Halanaerobiales bacterium]
MLFDYHLHSDFSADSKMTLKDICETAVQKNLSEIAVTDHHDIDYQDDQIEFNLDKNKYLDELEKYQNLYADRLTIKKGIEMGMQTHILNQCNQYLKDDFDFIIASFHTAEKKDLFNGDFFKNYQQWEAYLRYLQSILEVIDNFDNYSVIGHLDLVRRYGYYETTPDLMDNNKAVELIREILKKIIKNDKGIEVNTTGYYIGNGQNPLPSIKILKLYKELGGEILTIGSDSHSKNQIAYKFLETIALLKKIGLNKLTTFTKMKPTFHKI